MLLQKKKIEEIFRIFEGNTPQPATELIYKNNFELLIAVILSAQATDVSVNKATKNLFKEAPNAQAMVNIGIDKISVIVKNIGLFRSKAKNIFHCCNILVNKYNGGIPTTRKELETLPGVGKKTSGVVMNVAYQSNTLPVDTHVFRVSNRIGLVKTVQAEKTEEVLLKRLPDWVMYRAHHWLILHGRYICKARKPLCKECPIAHICLFPYKSQ